MDDLSIFSSKRESELLDTIPKLPQAGINDPLRSYQSPDLVLSSLIKELQLTWIAIMINYNVLFIVQTHGSNVTKNSSQGSPDAFSWFMIIRRILKKVSILPRAIDVAVNEVKFEFELRVLNGKYSCGGAREQYSKFEIQIRQKSIIA